VFTAWSSAARWAASLGPPSINVDFPDHAKAHGSPRYRHWKQYMNHGLIAMDPREFVPRVTETRIAGFALSQVNRGVPI
jgi:hypothetical protein